jgi:hypothetical protein
MVWSAGCVEMTGTCARLGSGRAHNSEPQSSAKAWCFIFPGRDFFRFVTGQPFVNEFEPGFKNWLPDAARE